MNVEGGTFPPMGGGWVMTHGEGCYDGNGLKKGRTTHLKIKTVKPSSNKKRTLPHYRATFFF